MGETLITISNEELFARAARATSLSRRLAEDSSIRIPIARKRREFQYQWFYPTDPESPPHLTPHPASEAITCIALSEHHVVFTTSSQLYIIDIATSHCSRGWRGIIADSAIQFTDSDQSVRFAMVLNEENLGLISQHVTVDQYALVGDAIGPGKPFDLDINSGGGARVRIEGDYVTVFDRHSAFDTDIIVCNWKKNTGQAFKIPPDVRSTDMYDPMRVHLHPVDSTVTITYVEHHDDHRPPRREHWIFTIHFANNMPSLRMSEKNPWRFTIDDRFIIRIEHSPTDPSQCRTTHHRVLNYPLKPLTNQSLVATDPHPRDRTQWNFNFQWIEQIRRSSGTSEWAIDFVKTPAFIPTPSIDMTVEHVSFSLTDLSLNTVPISKITLPSISLSSSSVDSFSRPMSPLLPYGYCSIFWNNAQKEIYVLRLADEYHPETVFIRLKMPSFKDWGLWHIGEENGMFMIGFDLLRGTARGTGNSLGMAAETSRLNLARIGLDIMLLISEYLCVQDIVALSQTCKRLRDSISRTKSALINTLNFHIIILPSHDSLATLTSKDLFTRAVNATALSRRLSGSIRGPIAAPLNKREILSKKSRTSRPDQGRLQSIRYNDRHVIFVCDHALYFVDLSTGSSVERPYNSFILTSFHDCDSSDEVLIALSIGSPTTLPHGRAKITLERCSLRPDTFGAFQNHITLALGHNSHGDVKFQGDLIAFIYKPNVILCNWKKYTAIVLPIPNYSQIFTVLTTDQFTALQLDFHPHNTTVILHCTTWSIGGHRPRPWLLSFEAPTEMPSLVPADDSGKLFLLDDAEKVQLGDPISCASGMTRYETRATNEREKFEVHVKMLFDPAPDNREYLMTVRPHVRDSTMDVVRYLHLLSSAETDRRFEHLRISLTDWSTCFVPVIPGFHPRRSYPNYSPKSFSSVLNESPYVSINSREREFYALRLADEYHPDSGFIRLKLPDFHKCGLPHLNSPTVIEITLIGFDMLRGWLFFSDGDCVHIFEY
ncbi:hypothetical protein SISNIDRAFT_534836 [Sistotremastrum niveocremeum HHB9708]|uniref:F-box domain-containing protein n=1 Tax=Sistotremastrum niveocremeum HHB9708 TaxID=1314777 RepID=A0A164NNW5_9AGAM|nr:hypothetical protein SISNIDRAFT_534836 [Sistotremastrum niveocremeum HHB9708]